MEPVELLTAALVGAVYGVVYAGYGIITKRESGEAISPKKAARSVVIFGAAGVIVSVRRGGAPSLTAIEQTTTEITVLGVAFDFAWSGLRKRGYLDWVPGVSA